MTLLPEDLDKAVSCEWNLYSCLYAQAYKRVTGETPVYCNFFRVGTANHHVEWKNTTLMRQFDEAMRGPLSERDALIARIRLQLPTEV